MRGGVGTCIPALARADIYELQLLPFAQWQIVTLVIESRFTAMSSIEKILASLGSSTVDIEKLVNSLKTTFGSTAI